MIDRTVRLREYLADCRRAVNGATAVATSGRLTRVSGLVMEAVGLRLPVGSQCQVHIPGGQSVEAEVAGFSGERLFIMPATDIYGVMPGAGVVADNPAAAQPPRLGVRYIRRRRAQDRVRQVPVGDALLGRVLDGAGRALDGLGPLTLEKRVPLYTRPINPLERATIRQTLDVGVRSINGLLTVGMWIEAPTKAIAKLRGGMALCPLLPHAAFFDDVPVLLGLRRRTVDAPSLRCDAHVAHPIEREPRLHAPASPSMCLSSSSVFGRALRRRRGFGHPIT